MHVEYKKSGLSYWPWSSVCWLTAGNLKEGCAGSWKISGISASYWLNCESLYGKKTAAGLRQTRETTSLIPLVLA